MRLFLSKLILSQVFSSPDQPLTSQLLLKDSPLSVQTPAISPSNIQQTCSCNLPVHSCCVMHSTHSQQILIYSSSVQMNSHTAYCNANGMVKIDHTSLFHLSFSLMYHCSLFCKLLKPSSFNCKLKRLDVYQTKPKHFLINHNLLT